MSALSPTRPSRRAATRRKVVIDEEDASDVENIAVAHAAEEDEEDDFMPATRGSRKSPRRRTAAGQDVSRLRSTGVGASRRITAKDNVAPSVEPSEIFDIPSEVMAEEPSSPTKRLPPKRRSVKDARAARKSRTSGISTVADASELHTSLPTPEPSATPEPRSQRGTPLTDITESTLNERTLEATQGPLTPVEERSTPAKAVSVGAPEMHLHEGEPMEGVEATMDPAQTPKATAVPLVEPDLQKPESAMDIVIKKRNLGIPLSQQPAVPRERMTITYLTLTNFKSYAGKQVVGPFHASFSSVVGPNGSGKSNVIDSLLFVFGFRASKMRQGKVSALIHNSARFPDLEFCEVEVQFQMVIDEPGGGTTVVPDSQLAISRRVFKNNNSRYYINGSPSDFTTVTTLLKARGVDLDHKRFLILQGEVESIAQMKPKAANEHDDGLLEYLEDIIGTSSYKAPIAELVTETDTLDEMVAERKSRMEHVEREKNGLEDKKNKALAFINDENELTLKRSAAYQLGLAGCHNNKNIAEAAIKMLEVELAEELTRHEGAENDIKTLEKRYQAGEKEHQRMEKENKDLSKRVDSLDKAAVKIEEKKKHLDNKSKKLKKALESSRLGLHESATLSKQAEEDISRITSDVEELEGEMQEEDRELGKIRESLKGKTQDLSDQIASKQKQLDPWTTKINERQSAAAVAQSELDILRERENAGAKAMAQIEERVRELKELRTSKSTLVQDRKNQREVAESELRSAHKRLDGIMKQVPSLQSKLSNARQKADEARASLSASKSQGEVLAALTRLSESGRIEGFHGRLGNLGAIDAKYDVAISTACPSLDNLVVDTVESAQQCIAYLRKNNLGRANFVVLDRLAKRDLSPIQTPENCPRLFDVIRSKHERYLPAFYHVLQNTIVADDSAQADRVAYGAKRWRVVSLEGKLVDKSGVMSGGGSKVARGAMSSKVVADVTKEQVATLEVDRETLEREYTSLQQQQNELEMHIRETEKLLPGLETEAQKLGLECDSIDREISDARKRAQELTAEKQPAKSVTERITVLEKTIADTHKEIHRLQTETKGFEEEIQDLQDRIMEIGGVKLRSQKSKVDGLREQIDSLNETLGAAEVAKTKSEKQQIKHNKAIQDASEEIEKVARETEKVEEEARNQSHDNSGLRREAEEANQALEDKKDELKDLKKQLDEQIAELNEGRGAVVDIQKKIEDNQKHLDSNQRQLDLHAEKLSKLTLHNFSQDGEEGEAEAVPELSPDEIAELDADELRAAIVKLEERTSQNVELSVLAEFHRRANEYASRSEDFSNAKANSVAAHQRLKDLKKLRHDGFMTGFITISARLKEMYQMITMGGNAELELVDSLDPFMEGVSFSVMPPKKSWKNISNLSGGEKTLSSLALVFALHHYKPTPLYVMDEIDAALDFRNVSIVAAYIKERTKNAQFIVISLRNNMFELASRLVGVYKVNHMTKSVTVENRDYIVSRDQQRDARS